MKTILSTGRVARFAARRGRMVLAVWLVGLVLMMAAAVTVGGELTEWDGKKNVALLLTRDQRQRFAAQVLVRTTGLGQICCPLAGWPIEGGLDHRLEPAPAVSAIGHWSVGAILRRSRGFRRMALIANS